MGAPYSVQKFFMRACFPSRLLYLKARRDHLCQV